jgi:hypothetical protein
LRRFRKTSYAAEAQSDGRWLGRARLNPSPFKEEVMIMRKILVSSLAALFALLSGGSAKAEGREIPYRELISGSAAPSAFVVNREDPQAGAVNGHYVTFAGRSNLGPVHGGILVGYDFPAAGPDPACPAGTIRFPILVSASNRALTGTDGQIFMQDDAASGLFCLDTTTSTFTMSLKGTFTGGMGAFAGATGTYEYKGSGKVLLMDAHNLPFGGFVLETKGTLILPGRSRH